MLKAPNVKIWLNLPFLVVFRQDEVLHAKSLSHWWWSEEDPKLKKLLSCQFCSNSSMLMISSFLLTSAVDGKLMSSSWSSTACLECLASRMSFSACILSNYINQYKQPNMHTLQLNKHHIQNKLAPYGTGGRLLLSANFKITWQKN